MNLQVVWTVQPSRASYHWRLMRKSDGLHKAQKNANILLRFALCFRYPMVGSTAIITDSCSVVLQAVLGQQIGGKTGIDRDETGSRLLRGVGRVEQPTSDALFSSRPKGS